MHKLHRKNSQMLKSENDTLQATDIEELALPGALGTAIAGIALWSSPLLARGRLWGERAIIVWLVAKKIKIVNLIAHHHQPQRPYLQSHTSSQPRDIIHNSRRQTHFS